MAKNESPLFPREPENNSEEQINLFEEVKQKLEAEETKSEIDLPVPIASSREDIKSVRPIYGPPPFSMKESTPFVEQNTPLPVPRQSPVRRNLILFFLLIGFLGIIIKVISPWLTSPQTPLPKQEKRL